MFEIATLTEARLATVTSRSEKHGDEDVPAVSMAIEIETGNSILDLLDPALRPTLYTRPEGQEDLPGVEQVLPLLRCNSFGVIPLERKHEGWTLNVDVDIDESQPMVFGNCKVDAFTVDAKQGGSVVLRFRVGTSDLDAARSGMLLMHNRQPIWITLIAPRPGAAPIDGSVDAFKADHPDAGGLFAEQHGDPDDADSEGGETDVDGDDPTEHAEDRAEWQGDAERQAEAERTGEAWPFPRGEHADQAPPQSVTTEPSRRTARGRAATRAALEARGR